MNGRQVSLAGHRFRAVVDPRIRGVDCADAAASDDSWTRYVRDGDATRSKATARVVLGSQPTPARLADGFVLKSGGVPNARQLEPNRRLAQADRRLTPGGLSRCRSVLSSRTVTGWKCISRLTRPRN